MNKIHTADAPAPAGHYSQAVVHSGTVYVAGQLPIDPRDPEKPAGPIEEQAEQVLRNVEAVLLAAGSSLDQVLAVTVYIADLELWGQVNEVYARIFGDHRPARAVIPVGPLRKGYQLEVQAIAAVSQR